MQFSQLPSDFLVLFAKLNELLRLYSIGKKLQKFILIKDKTKLKIAHIDRLLQQYPQYSQMKQDIRKRIESTYQQISSNPSSKVASQKSSVKAASIVPGKGQSFSNQSSQKEKTPKLYESSPLKRNSLMQISIQKPKTIISQKQKQTAKQLPKNTGTLQTTKDKEMPQKPFVQKQRQPEKKVEPILQKKQKQRTFLVQLMTPSSQNLISQKAINQFSSLNFKSSNPMSQSQQNKLLEMKAIEVQSISSIQNDYGQKPKSRQNSIIGILEQQTLQKPIFQKKSSQSFKGDEDSSQLQQKYSQGSVLDEVNDLIARFFQDHKDRINKDLIFNNQLFDQMQKKLDGLVYLFGVNKPQTKRINQLYACTIMKFSAAEINRIDDKYQKEMKDFSNNIRIPLGLIIKGQGYSAITPQQLKFLINLQSPYPTILVVKDDQANSGQICTFHQSIIDRIRITPRKQLSQFADQLKKKIFKLEYSQQHFPKDKSKVTTKFLPRVVPHLAQEAPNAIAISGNECIREQKHSFIYKLHTKFLIIAKTDYNIYYVNNNLVNARVSYKDKQFEAFKKQVLEGQSKIPTILSVNVGKQNAPIKRQFISLLYESRDKRDPFFFIAFSSLTVKKTVIATLKAEVTLEMIKQSEPIQYKNFEKDTMLTNCMHVITKNNIKEFQVTDGKADLIQIKAR